MNDQTTVAAIESPDGFSAALGRLERVRELMNTNVLIQNEDYGVVPGTSSKPTLFKSGAQKLMLLFDLASEVKEVHRVVKDDLIAYEVTVALRNKQTGVSEGEGVGTCNSKERRYKNQDAYNVANTLLKMAKKRGMVDAVLDALGASSLLTQDLEDMHIDAPQNGHKATGAQQMNDAAQIHDRLTEAQRGAILAIANKAFGRDMKAELSKLTDKPVDQLTRGEASSLVDQLRHIATPSAQQRPQQQRGDVPSCPKCQGLMWDNRAKKASGEISAKAPDFKCKDRNNCDAAIWLDAKQPAQRPADRVPPTTDADYYEPADDQLEQLFEQQAAYPAN